MNKLYYITAIIFITVIYSYSAPGDKTIVGPFNGFGIASSSTGRIRAIKPVDTLYINGASTSGGVITVTPDSIGAVSKIHFGGYSTNRQIQIDSKVASVSGTSPIVSSGGTTPIISLASVPFSNMSTGMRPSLAAKEPTLPLTTLGDTLYQGASGRVALAGNTTITQKFLSQTGTGTVSAAPSWQTLPVSGQLTYYFQNTASAIVGYLKMLTAPYSPKTTLTFSGISTTPVVIQNWATDSGFPGLGFMPSGTYILHAHSANTGTGNATIYGEFWEVNSSGVDIAKIGTTETSFQVSGTYLNNTETEYEMSFVNPNVYTMATTSSRIVLRLYGVMAGGTHSLEIYVGGTADSHIELPANSVDATNFLPYSGATNDLALGTHAATGTSFNSITALASSTSPMDGSATVGTSTTVARQDHIHPTDTSRVATSQTINGVAYGSGNIQTPITSSSDYTVAGTWTPVFTNLTVVNGTGSVIYSGYYTVVGKLVFWRVALSCSGTATTASVANSTSFTMPLTLSGAPAPFVVTSNTIQNIGIGAVYTGTTAYAPTWTTTGNSIYMSGVYITP